MCVTVCVLSQYRECLISLHVSCHINFAYILNTFALVKQSQYIACYDGVCGFG